MTLTPTRIAAAAALACIALPALAEDDSPQTLDKVIVTAQKREQAAIDVPASVTAVNAQRLSAAGLSQLEDYVAQIPGMSITSNGGSMQVTLRGISTGLSQSSPTTSIYIDDAPVGSVNAYTTGATQVPDIDPADLRRIEVLKGPQGTLFGAGAMGGMLRYVTATPSFDKVAGTITAGAESTDHGDTGHLLRASVNLPFADHKMALRVSAFGHKLGGYIDNVAAGGRKNDNETDISGGQVAYAWQINPDWRLNALALTQTTDADGSNGVDVKPMSLTPLTGAYTTSNVVPVKSKRKLDLGNVAIHGNVGDVTLVSSTTLQNVGAEAIGDGSQSFGTLLALVFQQPRNVQSDQITHTHRFTQELRAEGAVLDGRLNWQTGLYYTQEDDSNRIPAFGTFDPATGAALPVYYPGTTTPFPDGLAKAHINTTYKETSLFANATYSITPKFDVQLGLRWGRDRQHYDQLYTGLLYPTGVSLTQDATHSKATYLLTASYKASATDAFYGRIATGYRPGGPSAATPDTGFSPIVGPDSLTSAEVGWKSVFMQGKASFEVALFHTDWKDIQIQTKKNTSNFFVNGGKAVSQGLESTLSFYPVQGLSVRGSFGYTDAHLTSDTTNVLVGTVPLGKSGDRLPFVPKVTASLASDYRFAVGGGWAATVGGSVSRIGQRVSDYSGNPSISLPAYTTVDLNAALDSGAWRLSAYVKNLNNSDGVIYLGSRGLLPTQPWSAGYVRPRTIGLQASYSF
ncbi:TonB-dependent receptor [Pelomonas sp. KK5]|uniref:TonB-dependent receptor n=1 Tax=Pelomonas sp. KK5 TaxID=1855730 RepID=UPI00097BE7DD|nr:TonB-dependent receptor [Pelomonas sp. KK5]